MRYQSVRPARRLARLRAVRTVSPAFARRLATLALLKTRLRLARFPTVSPSLGRRLGTVFGSTELLPWFRERLAVRIESWLLWLLPPHRRKSYDRYRVLGVEPRLNESIQRQCTRIDGI